MKFRLPASFGAAYAEAASVASDPRLLSWSLFIIFFPFYVLPSGLPQPSAWLLILMIPSLISAWDGRLSGRWQRPVLLSLAWFCAYVLIINLAWSVILGTFTINLKEGFGLSPVFYIYNAILFFSILLLYRRYQLRFLWVTSRAVLMSIVVQVLVALVLPTRMRAAAAFNEPNQLGYYALVSACILLLCQKRTKLSTLQVSLGLLACSYLALVSASKAALGSIGLLAIAILIGRLRTVLIAGLAFLVLILTPNPFSDAMERAEIRMATDQSLDFFEERGYDRILNHPEYWVLGSGEGDYQRFKDTTLIGSHELHSSMGTLFFCYGIVGLTLFMVFMWMIMRRTHFHTWLVMGPAFAYGMTHQGLRFSLMWVLLGVVVALRESNRTPEPTT